MTRTQVYWLVALAIVAASWAVSAIVYPSMPATVPTHWNIHGKVDAHGSKATLFLMPAAMIGMLALFAFLPTLSPKNLVISERRYPNRVGQTYAITYDPAHKWFWFPRMRREEALVFKVFDSLKDGRARWTAHTAFADPTSPPHARPRESIEIRTLAFF